ncbi:hypothetical protein COL0001_15310 [Helicobacter pylori]
MALKITAKKAFLQTKRAYKIYNNPKKAQKQQRQSKKPLRMPFCLYGVSMLFAIL